VKRLCEEISLLTRRTTVGQEAGELVGAINAKLRGWANYFSLGPVSRAYRAVDRHTRDRLRRWLCTKHKVQGPGGQTFPAEHLYERLGLLRLEALTGNLPWAKAKKTPVRKPDAENPHVRFDEWGVETERRLSPPRHSSTLQFFAIRKVFSL